MTDGGGGGNGSSKLVSPPASQLANQGLRQQTVHRQAINPRHAFQLFAASPSSSLPRSEWNITTTLSMRALFRVAVTAQPIARSHDAKTVSSMLPRGAKDAVGLLDEISRFDTDGRTPHGIIRRMTISRDPGCFRLFAGGGAAADLGQLVAVWTSHRNNLASAPPPCPLPPPRGGATLRTHRAGTTVLPATPCCGRPLSGRSGTTIPGPSWRPRRLAVFFWPLSREGQRDE